jgi:hypothetical protein
LEPLRGEEMDASDVFWNFVKMVATLPIEE